MSSVDFLGSSTDTSLRMNSPTSRCSFAAEREVGKCAMRGAVAIKDAAADEEDEADSFTSGLIGTLSVASALDEVSTEIGAGESSSESCTVVGCVSKPGVVAGVDKASVLSATVLVAFREGFGRADRLVWYLASASLTSDV